MRGFEYQQLQQKKVEEFNKIDHDNELGIILKDNLDFIINFPHKSKEAILKYQLDKVGKLVDYAYLNIPLYRQKYKTIGFKPGDIKTFEDFEKLPILYKDELISGFPNDLVKNIEDFKFSTRSSGSSGKFVTIAVDLDAIYTDTIQGMRQFIRQSNFEYTKNDVVLFIYTDPWWISSINGKYKQDFLPTTTAPQNALEHIKKIKPLIINTYPTYLQKLCELDVKISSYGVKYAIVHSEHSTKEARHDMGKALDIEVYDEFSSEELTRIALECKYKNYHLEEDSCYIETIDTKTNQKVTNGVGLLVGTNLINTATPIIRYHQGDIVRIDSKKNCDCGHNGRIISEIQGREMDCIQSNGKKIPASAFMDMAYNWFLIKKIPIHGMQYQIVQTSENQICVNLLKGLYELTEADFEIIKESFYSLVDRNITINIGYTDVFIQKSNKFKPVINLIGIDKL